MICENCKCVVPDASIQCMYCGHRLFGAEKTQPVTQGGSTRRVTFYETFPASEKTEPVTHGYRNSSSYYHNRSYSPYGGYDNYNRSSNYNSYSDRHSRYNNNGAYRDYNNYGYDSYGSNYNSNYYQSSYDAPYYAPDNSMYYDYNRPYSRRSDTNSYREYSYGYHDGRRHFRSDFNRALIYLVAVDALFLLIIFMILLLVTI